MIAVAGLWELGHSCPLTEVELWCHPLREFGVSEWYMAPVSGIAHNEGPTEWERPEVMYPALRERWPLVFVTEDAEVELRDFEHPERACYVFGKANWSAFQTFRGENDLAVRIQTQGGGSALWPHQCLVTVLWHRRTQWP